MDEIKQRATKKKGRGFGGEFLVAKNVTLDDFYVFFVKEHIAPEQKGQYDSIHQDDKEGPMRCEFWNCNCTY